MAKGIATIDLDWPSVSNESDDLLKPHLDFRKEWIDGKWVNTPESLTPGHIPWGTHVGALRLAIDADWKVTPSYLDRERALIESEKIRRAVDVDRKYYEHHKGGDFSGRLDSFGITLKSAKEEHERLKSGFAALDKKEEEIKMARKKRATKKESSPFRKGRATGVKSRGGQFIRLADGESVVFAPMIGLDEMVSADMHEYWDVKPAIYHPCIGRNCPGCLVENEPRFKGYLPVLVKSTGEPAIYPFTISVYNQLEALEDEIMEDDDGATLKGLVIKVSRKGSMKATRYSVLGVGSRIDLTGAEVPDFVPQLGPTTEEEIWTLLEENDFDRSAYEATTATSSESESTETEAEGWGDV